MMSPKVHHHYGDVSASATILDSIVQRSAFVETAKASTTSSKEQEP